MTGKSTFFQLPTTSASGSYSPSSTSSSSYSLSAIIILKQIIDWLINQLLVYSDKNHLQTISPLIHYNQFVKYPMASISIKYNEYLIVLNKKNETSLALTAHTEQGRSIFENPIIELKKIKYDTVVAALNKQNEKNLFTKIHYQPVKDNEVGKLLISVIVRYDFLPEFSQEIILTERMLNENDSLRVKLTNIEKQLSDITKNIKALDEKGVINIEQRKTVSGSKGADLGELSLSKGKYLIQVSGLYKGTVSGQKLILSIELNQKQSVNFPEITPYFLSAPYSSPYSFSEVIELSEDSKLTLQTRNNLNVQNHVFMAKPIIA